MDRSEMNGGYGIPAFRENHSVLKEEIRNLKRNNTVLQYCDFYKICMDVEEKILDFDEEPNLSVLQNKVRKLDTGSELCKEICLLQRHLSNLEINKAVSEVLDEKKYEEISRKIMLRKQSELKREKFFMKQAADVSKLFPAEHRDHVAEPEVVPTTETVSIPAEALQSPNLEVEVKGKSEHVPESGPETARIVGQENGNPVDENVRVSNVRGTKLMDLPSSFGDITVPDIEARKTDWESEFNVDLNELERILENGITDLEVNEKAEVPKLTNGDIAQSEDLENLPPLNDTHARRRKRHLPVFDISTNIRSYSKRARRLNSSVNVERVQVYEGPPSIIRAFTIGYVMETPAVNNGYFGAVRGSGTSISQILHPSNIDLLVTNECEFLIQVIQKLYCRHQKTEQTSDHALQDFQSRSSRALAIPSGVEEVIGPRQESRSDVQKSLLLDISAVQTDRTEMRGAAVIQSNGDQMQTTHWTDAPPSSNMLQKEMVPSFNETSDPRPPRFSRRNHLQDRSLEAPTADPWFKPIEVSAPREKWREFKYVRKCLEEIWMEKEEKNLEKSASLREVLEKEHEWGKENMLTLLRIVDKMSLRREVVIKGHGISVIIQPFEMPFVTGKQYSLHGHAPRF